MTSRTVLSVEEITIRYGAAVAVEGLTLQVQAGEIYGLLGPNGSGKSSTLSAIAGIHRPTSGRIALEGLTVESDRVGYLRRVGLIPQELAVYEEMSSLENLRFFGRLYGLGRLELRQRVAEAIEFVQLTEAAHRPVRELSGGMQRRLNLACALLHQPGLLLLDEPTVGLDITSRDAIFHSLRELRARGCALVFTTHHLEEVEQLCDRIGVMQHGQLLAEGTLEQLESSIGLQAGRASRRTPRPRLERIYLRLMSGSSYP